MRARVAVVVPAADPPDLDRCLAALTASDPAADELLVVDDGSQSPIVAPIAGPGVLRLDPRRGPAAARNAGAAATTAEVVVFVDSDVLVAPGTVSALLARLDAAPEAGAIQAIYAEACPVPGFAAAFHNLFQRYNLLSVRDPERFGGLSSFCVAVRRAALDAAGGFDEQVGRPTVEDDNLAHALLRGGWRIHLAPEIEVQHLSRPTVTGLARRMAAMASDKVLSIRRRPGRAAVAPHRTHHRWAFLVGTAAWSGGVVLLPWAPVPALGLCGLGLAVSVPFALTCARIRGPAFGVAAAGATALLCLAAGAGAVHGLCRSRG